MKYIININIIRRNLNAKHSDKLTDKRFILTVAETTFREYLTVCEELRTLRLLIEGKGVKMPGFSPIQELINSVSSKTMQAIFDAQIRMIPGEELDDLKELTVDSTL